MPRHLSTGFALLLSLAAVSAAAETKLRDPVGLQQDAAAILDATDWSQAESVEVLLEDHSFSPSHIVFERNRPYILRLRNVGRVSHDMAGGSFFSGIAIKLVQNDAGRLVTPVLRSLYLRRDNQMDVWFVPLRAGQYSFFCGIPGHREHGMEGEITIR